MRKITLLTLFIIFGTFFPQSALMGSNSHLGVSVFDPIQYPDRSSSVDGIRLNLFYGRNQDVNGLDLGVLLPVTLNTLNGRLWGLQISSYNETGSGTGIQWGFVNYSRRDFTGIQFSLGNITGGTTIGTQIGFINRTGKLRGIQVGIFNYAENLTGLQVGLSNLRGNPNPKFPRAAPAAFFPLVNWSF